MTLLFEFSVFHLQIRPFKSDRAGLFSPATCSQLLIQSCSLSLSFSPVDSSFSRRSVANWLCVLGKYSHRDTVLTHHVTVRRSSSESSLLVTLYKYTNSFFLNRDTLLIYNSLYCHWNMGEKLLHWPTLLSYDLHVFIYFMYDIDCRCIDSIVYSVKKADIV